ncbi:MAG TPA: DMT family transporter [Anaerolineae bacterium]|nr:DMT family transporter [Anaerolineae bacterium]
MSKERLKAIFITMLVLISMSFGAVMTKLSFSSISPITYIWLTLLIGMITMFIYTFIIKKERIPHELMTRKVWFYIIQIGFFNFFIGRLVTFSLNYLPVTTTSYLINFIGFFTMAMSCVILKEFPTIFQIIGAVVAFIGLRVFFSIIPQGGELIGMAMILVSILGIAYTNNITRKLALETENEISNNIISTLALIIGGSITVVLCLILDVYPPIIPTTLDWAVIIYTGIITTAIGLTVWNLILRTLRSYEASILGASTVVWTSLMAALILKETLTVNQIIGICMMIISICLVQVRGSSLKRIFTNK